MTIYNFKIKKLMLIGACILPVTIFAGLSPSEWAQYKRDCYNSGGSPGMHLDGSPGCCHIMPNGDMGDLKKVKSYKAFKNYKGSAKFKGVEPIRKIKHKIKKSKLKKYKLKK